MIKKAEHNKVSTDRVGLTLEQQTVYDDSLLPPADELKKINDISKDVLPWLMKRSEIEQNARIRFNDERIGLAKSEMSHNHKYSFVSLIMAFFIVIISFGISLYLIISGKDIVGSIFAGATVVLIISYFLKAKKKDK